MVRSLSAVSVHCEETCRSSEIRGILKLCIADEQLGSDEKISLFALGLLSGSPRSRRCQCSVCLFDDVSVLISVWNHPVGQFSPEQNPRGQ